MTMTEDGWVLACESADVGERPRAAQVDGRALVLWRSAGGRLSALDDECPHQGNALSLGTVVGGSLRCAFHGWEVGTDGWCDRAGMATASHPVKEVDGGVWVRLCHPRRPARTPASRDARSDDR